MMSNTTQHRQKEDPLRWRRDQLLDQLGEYVTTDQLIGDRLAHALNTVHFVLGGEEDLAFAAALKAHELDIEIKARAWGDDL
jgi:hypothetical protein